MLKTYEEIYNKVKTDYDLEDVELNSLFFDFDVSATAGILLSVYADLQSDINGDHVIHLKNPVLEIIDDAKYIWGTEDDAFDKGIPDVDLDKIFQGNMKDFLESFNDRECETGWCRVDMLSECPKDAKLIGGNLLSFVF